MENEALEAKVAALEEANDALRAMMPSYQDRVARFVRSQGSGNVRPL
jgi:hypothetical protein